MKHYKCQNCGASLVKKDERTYICEYCKNTYEVEVADKVYETACKHIKLTTQTAISEALLEQRLELIANARKNLWIARRREFISNDELKKWSNEIRKYNPYDVQANFFMLAADKRWGELNKYLRKIKAKDNIRLIIGFVTYLTSGQFIEKCILTINDMIASAIPETSPTYKKIHEIIAKSAKTAKSGIFDETLPRDVFVAYSSKDKDKAYELVEYLEERGLSCFISMRNLPKGVDAELLYNERLKRAMDNCQVFLFVSSKNSRVKGCDAYSLEMQYIKDQDVKQSNNPNYYRNNYQQLIENYRGKCKPRVEYLIQTYGNSIYEEQVKNFFSGLSWCTDKEKVFNSIKKSLMMAPTKSYQATTVQKTTQSVQTVEKINGNIAQKKEVVQAKAKKRAKISPLHEHVYVDEIVPSTCIARGCTVHKCRCGYEYRDSYTKLADHKYKYKSSKEPTCSEEGYKEYICTVCSDIKKDFIQAKGHTFGKWVEQLIPTCAKKGKSVRQCQKCGFIEEKDIPALNHDWGEAEYRGGASGKGSYYVVCKLCGKEKEITNDRTNGVQLREYNLSEGKSNLISGFLLLMLSLIIFFSTISVWEYLDSDEIASSVLFVLLDVAAIIISIILIKEGILLTKGKKKFVSNVASKLRWVAYIIFALFGLVAMISWLESAFWVIVLIIIAVYLKKNK